MTYTLQEAKDLVNIVNKSGVIFALTHNYTGYPMVKQARHMVRIGELGDILKIVVEYSQGWLMTALEDEGQKQASWRTDPKRSGFPTVSVTLAPIVKIWRTILPALK